VLEKPARLHKIPASEAAQMKPEWAELPFWDGQGYRRGRILQPPISRPAPLPICIAVDPSEIGVIE
jgi:hypothetical protein